MKRKIWSIIFIAIGGLLLGGVALAMMPGSRVVLGAAPEPEPFTYTATLRFGWGAGYKVVTSTEAITITDAFITMELRDEDGNVLSRQRQAVPDCGVVYSEADVPASGPCGAGLIFTFTSSHTGYVEEWVLGEFVGINGVVYTYTVGSSPSLGIDENGFHLIGVANGEWYDVCPPDPLVPTPTIPQPTYTPQPTYVPEPTPTCRATYTPVPPDATPTLLPTPTLYPTNTPYPPQPS